MKRNNLSHNKKFYCLVISSLDEYGNRIDSLELAGDTNRNRIQKQKTKYKKNLNEYSYMGDNLCLDLEVRNYETNDLLWIEEL